MYIKGTRKKAATVWGSMLVEKMTPEEVADDRDVPLGAVLESIEWCEANIALIEAEAAATLELLKSMGLWVEA